MDPTSPDTAAVLAREIGAWKIQTTVAVSVFGLLGLSVWLWFRRADKRDALRLAASQEARKAERALRLTQVLEGVQSAVAGIHARQADMAKANADLVASHQELADAVRIQVALARGALNPVVSRELIEREMIVLQREVVYAFQSSLRHNHYRDYEEEIRDKMRQALAVMFDRTVSQLSRFDLSVDHGCYLRKDASGKRFEFIDTLWDSMVPFYKKPVDYRHDRDAQERNTAVRQAISALFRDEILDGRTRADQEFRVDRDSATPSPTPDTRVQKPSSRSGFHAATPKSVPELDDSDRLVIYPPLEVPTDRIER